jgi:hypothetical protein
LTDAELRLLELTLTPTEILNTHASPILSALLATNFSAAIRVSIMRDRAFLLRALSVEETDELQQQYVVRLVDAYRRWLIRDCPSYQREVRRAVGRLCAVETTTAASAYRFARSILRWRNRAGYLHHACVGLFDTALCSYTPYLTMPDVIHKHEAVRLLNVTTHETDISAWGLYGRWLELHHLDT